MEKSLGVKSGVYSECGGVFLSSFASIGGTVPYFGERAPFLRRSFAISSFIRISWAT